MVRVKSGQMWRSEVRVGVRVRVGARWQDFIQSRSPPTLPASQALQAPSVGGRRWPGSRWGQLTLGPWQRLQASGQCGGKGTLGRQRPAGGGGLGAQGACPQAPKRVILTPSLGGEGRPAAPDPIPVPWSFVSPASQPGTSLAEGRALSLGVLWTSPHSLLPSCGQPGPSPAGWPAGALPPGPPRPRWHSHLQPRCCCAATGGVGGRSPPSAPPSGPRPHPGPGPRSHTGH